MRESVSLPLEMRFHLAMALYIDVLIREAFVSKLSLVLLARTQPVMVQGHVMRPTARESTNNSLPKES